VQKRSAAPQRPTFRLRSAQGRRHISNTRGRSALATRACAGASTERGEMGRDVPLQHSMYDTFAHASPSPNDMWGRPSGGAPKGPKAAFMLCLHSGEKGERRGGDRHVLPMHRAHAVRRHNVCAHTRARPHHRRDRTTGCDCTAGVCALGVTAPPRMCGARVAKPGMYATRLPSSRDLSF